MNEAHNLDHHSHEPRVPRRRRRVTGDRARRSETSLRVAPDDSEQRDAPTAQWDIRTVDGIEGERLAAQQAQVLWEVMAWLAQNKS